MKFEISGYDISYDRNEQIARIYWDDHPVLEARFREPIGIRDLVSGVALTMVREKILSMDDIKDVMDVCEGTQ